MPFGTGLSVQGELGSALSGRVGLGWTAHLTLKRQAIQMPPFQGETQIVPPRSASIF